MASVKAFRVDGVRMIFHSGDHRPPHLHARRGNEWDVRVYIQEAPDRMIELKGPPDARMRPSDRKAIIDGVEKHRAELLAEWEACQEESE